MKAELSISYRGTGFIFRFFDDKIKINEELERDFMKARKVSISSLEHNRWRRG